MPDALKSSINQALATSRAPMPLLLTLGQWCSLGSGLIFLMVLAFAPFNMGTYRIGDEVVTGPEFMRQAGWLFAAIGGLLLAIGIALLRESEWARPLMILYWLSLALLSFVDAESGVGDVVGGVVAAVGAAGIAAWYLYRKPNVRAYFEARSPATSLPGVG